MGRFRHLLSDLELKELHLHGRLFTWSNERTHPTLERIDRVFVSAEWEDLYPNSYLQSLYSGCSDHAPLLL
jgi:endonuclease/exonuclease/phosphatase family metal-dependent hydrolase